jgi:hypothetical protein
MAGVSIPVSIRISTERGGLIRLTAMQEERQVDQEVYQDNASAFSLDHAAGETFRPPVPLLVFPMHIGDNWDWSGTTTLENSSQAARATVRTAMSRTVIDGSPANSVEVDVDLQMGVNTATPMKRHLKFWFVKGKGIVRRSFGEESVREPRSDSRPGAKP